MQGSHAASRTAGAMVANVPPRNSLRMLKPVFGGANNNKDVIDCNACCILTAANLDLERPARGRPRSMACRDTAPANVRAHAAFSPAATDTCRHVLERQICM